MKVITRIVAGFAIIFGTVLLSLTILSVIGITQLVWTGTIKHLVTSIGLYSTMIGCGFGLITAGNYLD